MTRIAAGSIAPLLGLLGAFMLTAAALNGCPADAHQSWIASGGYKSPAGESCCGDNDCAMLSKSEVTEQIGGWHVVMPAENLVGLQTAVDELVPYRESMPSPDGEFWRCRRPDGSRRCFFAPPPGS